MRSRRTDLEKRQKAPQLLRIVLSANARYSHDAGSQVALQALKDTHPAVLAQPRVRPSPTRDFSTPSPTPTSTPFKKKAKEKHKKKVTSSIRFSGRGRCRWAADLHTYKRERASASLPTLLSAAQCYT